MATTTQAILFVSMIVVFSGQSATGNTESDALIAFKGSLNDPNGFLNSWDPTLDNPCSWFHVNCDSNNRVTQIDLGSINLSGKMVPELGSLESLQFLLLYRNSIEGSIPMELGNLRSLVSLDLSGNQLSGTIPSTLGNLNSLNFLRLNRNKLTGEIPQELTKIPNLHTLDLSSNDLNGVIPQFPNVGFTNFSNNPRLIGSPPVEAIVPNFHRL